MIMRNLMAPIITNGTRAIVKHLSKNVILAEISTGPYKNEEILIPRIPLYTDEMTEGFSFKRT